MKFVHIFNKTALYIAVEKKNKEMIQLLLTRPDININDLSMIFNSFSFSFDLNFFFIKKFEIVKI